MRRFVSLLAVLVVVALLAFPSIAAAADTAGNAGTTQSAAIATLQSIAVIVAITKLIRLKWKSIDGLLVAVVAIVAGIGLELAVFAFGSAEWFGFAAKGLIDALTAVGVMTAAQAAAPTTIVNNPEPVRVMDFTEQMKTAARIVGVDAGGDRPAVRPERPRDPLTGRFASSDK